MRRIVVVEDQRLYRECSCALLTDAGYEVHEARDGIEAISVIMRVQPEVVLLDIEMPMLDGIQAIEEVRKNGEVPAVLAVSALCNARTVHRVMEAKLDGFIDKGISTTSQLLAAVKAVTAGDTYFSKSFLKVRSEKLGAARSFHRLLSRQEQEVLIMIGKLWRDAEIAAHLKISTRTVEAHMHALRKKLGVHSRVELQQYANEHGFA